ncbi:MAG: hypothetical protein WCC27_12780 [Acidobacteriaceae bacterium]
MRKVAAALGLLCFCTYAIPQAASSDSNNETLLAKTRALYDAPFTRNLVSFDCEVRFDWKDHFLEFVKIIPPDGLRMAERLQNVRHRVFVDRSGAVVSAVPKAPDFTDAPAVAKLEQVFDGMVSGGLTAWLPSSMGEILPIAPTKYTFEANGTGYRLTMHGPGVVGTLLLRPDLRVTSGVIQFPQPMRFESDFISGPSGFVLGSVKTGSTSDPSAAGEAGFSYSYQTVQGVQLPYLVTVTPSTTEPWHYTLTDCKVATGITIHVLPSPKP